MYELLVCLRAQQLLAQHYHNLCARVPFHQDHAFFAEVYEQASDDYDSVIERIIGLKGEDSLSIQSILGAVMKKIQAAPSVGVKENSVFYEVLLAEEVYICEKIKQLIVSGQVSPGTEQLIGDIANRSESRQYKIKQRIKK